MSLHPQPSEAETASAGPGSAFAAAATAPSASGSATATPPPPPTPSTVVVAGAGGFVGQALVPRLAPRLRVVGLSRSARADAYGIAWRRADLFSLLDAEQALAGADLAVYLVHSMLPRDALVQGSFADLDLICADNFGRAARTAGVRQIVYLGGLIPPFPEHELSPHLRSRLEVERVLGAHGVPVTTIRAGLIVGADGSSFRILRRLVERLPIMVTPEWTETRTQPVALDDVVAAIDHCVGRADALGQTYDLGGPEVLTYRRMMEETARALGLRRPMLTVPILTPRLSGLWLSLVTGAPRALVDPLVESLLHPMVVRDGRLAAALATPPRGFRDALAEALAPTPAPKPVPTAATPSTRTAPARPRLVRSVQRLRLPPDWCADDAARAYLEWLPRFLRGLVHVRREGPHRAVFRLGPAGPSLLELTYSPTRSTPDRALLYVTGGGLAVVDPSGERRGRIELRGVLQGAYVLTAVHDFQPRLPWALYTATQAPFHLFVMRRFGRYLERCARRGTPPPPRGD